MLLAELAEVSVAVSATSSRLAKVTALGSALRAAGADEAPVVVSYLSGELPQRQIGVGWAALRTAPPPAPASTLTVLAVDDAFTRIKAVSGKGAAAERKRLVGELFGAATADEQYFLVRLLSGELRQGALDGVMTDAVAKAAEVPVAEVRRAVMLSGSLAVAAQAALTGGGAALARFGLQVGRPLKPMLAASEASIDEALTRAGGRAAVEWKLDGIRVQAHVSRSVDSRSVDSRSVDSRSVDTGTPQVRLFTRSLDDITERLPEVVSALTALPVSDAVLDGELIALRQDGRPYAFQDTASRTASEVDVHGTSNHGTSNHGASNHGASNHGAGKVPLSVFLFDALHLDGKDLIDLPDADRHAALAKVVPETMRMPRLVTDDQEKAKAFFDDAVSRGHEGVVVKSLATPYAAGRRGAGWIKVKPRHTLDLVVLAVEWGHGRRKGWLSNLHLGARDPETDGWVMLGKTFKGLTDELLTWQTEKLQALEDHHDDWTVYVRPELVVEIAFDGVQRSPRYPGGVALRFARVIRYREDKPASEADTIEAVTALAPPTDD